MKIMDTWSIRSRKLKKTGNGSLQLSRLWILQTLGVIAVALCLSLQAAAAPDDIDEQIREKQKLLEQLTEEYKFLQLFEKPGIWVVQILFVPYPIPVSKYMIERSVGAHYLQEVFSGKMTVKEYEKKVSSTIREIEKFDRAFKAELKQRMAENKGQQNQLRTEIAALQKRKSLPPPTEPSKGAEATAKAEILDPTKWTRIELTEYGFTGTFTRQEEGEGRWTGSWPGGCQSSTFRLISRTASTKIEGMDQFDIVLVRTDNCSFSPGLRAEYRLVVSGLGTTVTLKGKRIVTNPGTLESMSWLKGNIADVTGSATK